MLVIKLKDIINLIKKVLIIVLLIMLVKIFGKLDLKNITNNFFKDDILSKKILILNYDNTKFNLSKKILTSKLILYEIEESEDNNKNIEKNKFEKVYTETKQPKSIERIYVPVNVETKVILENNTYDNYTDIYKSVKIKNESSYKIEESMLEPDFDVLNKKDIIIYHTHTCESYKKTDNSNYEETSNFRTTNLEYSVARVGDELEKYLGNFGFNVIHNKTYHDYPAYTGSYTRGLDTIAKILEDNPTDIVIDLHRDALGNFSSYAPSVQIGNEVVAQVMFVIGTDGGDLKHPDWKNNLKNAVRIQEKANEMYPGLFRAIILRDSRYNQHVADGACIIEVGATGNTLEQCIGSMKYLANVISQVYEGTQYNN